MAEHSLAQGCPTLAHERIDPPCGIAHDTQQQHIINTCHAGPQGRLGAVRGQHSLCLRVRIGVCRVK